MAPTNDYDILSAPTADELKVLVQAAIKSGWQVYGGLIYANHTVPLHRKDNFYQAIIKTPNLMEQMLTQLQAINTSTANIDLDADTLKSNTGTTASNTTSIKNSTASIDSKTPAP